MGDELNDLVECHSGFEYAERPIALHWQGQRLEIIKIEAQWRTPEGRRFRVLTVAERRFELFYSEVYNQWKIDEL